MSYTSSVNNRYLLQGWWGAYLCTNERERNRWRIPIRGEQLVEEVHANGTWWREERLSKGEDGRHDVANECGPNSTISQNDDNREYESEGGGDSKNLRTHCQRAKDFSAPELSNTKFCSGSPQNRSCRILVWNFGSTVQHLSKKCQFTVLKEAPWCWRMLRSGLNAR